MTGHLEKLLPALALLALITPASPQAFQTVADPLALARTLAARYPEQASMSYIPALAWAGQMRLSNLTGEPQWRDRALKAIESFTSGQTPAIAEPYRLTSLAGALAFAEAGAAGDTKAPALLEAVASLMVKDRGVAPVNFMTEWTDDMFMAGSVLWRATANADRSDALRRVLLTSIEKLQREDGLFIHAPKGPHAWGRGNGFALLGLTEALTHQPPDWGARAQVLAAYRKHVAALAKHQSDDGSWRQVVDDPASYRELTVTAMVTAAMARGIARGWIDRQAYEPIVNRGWQAVADRVNADGTVKDVCSSTGAGQAKEYYLNRPVVNGADDRGGAMALLAAIEVASLRKKSLGGW
jgi:rhamnogalacturonyl hydrolase YesR